MGINLTYCIKEYCLYSYFDKYVKETYPSIIDNLFSEGFGNENRVSYCVAIVATVHDAQSVLNVTV